MEAHMPENTHTPTTIPADFASVAATFRLSRPRPVVLSPVQAAHRDMLLALSQETPHTIVGHTADRFDLMDAKDHLRQVLGAVTNYVKIIVADAKWYSPVNIHDETGLLSDAASDICGGFENGIEQMLELQADAAE
jgi:hypothetical protein